MWLRSWRLAICALTVVLGLAAVPALGRAQGAPSAESELTAIRDQMRQAGFRAAATAVEAFLRRTDLTATQRNQALEIDAIVSLARRDEARATQSLGELYARDPGHRLSDPDASPVVQGAFARARDAATVRTVGLETTSASYLGRSAPVVAVRITSGLDQVSELRLSVRL